MLRRCQFFRIVSHRGFPHEHGKPVDGKMTGGFALVAWPAEYRVSGVMTFVILKVVGLVIPLRATAAEENEGLDVSQHGEDAYVIS